MEMVTISSWAVMKPFKPCLREEKRYPLVSIPPFGRGFSRHSGLPIRCVPGRARKKNFRALEHRLDEPARLSLGMDCGRDDHR